MSPQSSAPPQVSRGVTPGFKADVAHFDVFKYAPTELIGREAETKLLSDAWDQAVRAEQRRPHVVTFVALGGEGKTSLVAKWAAELAHQDWPACDAVFAWSFYSQGTREQAAASSDVFLKEALTFFGDSPMAISAAGAFDKGRRLAQLVGERRALLILDGLEPLQYAPTSPTPGELKDQGIAALLKGLAATNQGLCVVTTRYSMPDLRAYWQTTAPEHELKSLSVDAGVDLLKKLGVRGTQKEFEKLVDDVDGHALTLNLLGGFLKRAFKGDIRQRDRVKFEKANEKIQGGHAFRAMAAYEEWLLEGGDEGHREVAILRLLGLFDRPADAGCINALRGESIADLTEPIVGLEEDDWEFSVTGLEDAKLLTVTRDAADTLLSLDAHPLLREYFARQLRTQQPEAWRAAHRRLYEHLCATTTDKKPEPTLEDLQPLYQAVAHGCQAGLQQEVCDEVYFARIGRGNEFYSSRKLGALGSDLGAVASFFEAQWNRVSPTLTEVDQAWLLNAAALRLRSLGRLTEALEPMRATKDAQVQHERWKNAAQAGNNLSELELTPGEVAGAVGDAEESVTYADRSGDAFMREVTRTTHAHAVHQAGRRVEAEARFREAEDIHAEDQPDYPQLYSLQGFQYCELLLSDTERAAWQTTLQLETRNSKLETAAASCRAVSERAAQTIKIAQHNNWLLDIALDHLTLGRAAFFAAILEESEIRNPKSEIDAAVAGLRRAGEQIWLTAGLITHAWVRSLMGKHTGPEGAQTDLDEAWEIAERGPMKLFMADIHLYRARLFHGAKPYPWTSPQEDLTAARKLIHSCGYWRRKEELEDAEAAAKNW